MAHWPVSSYHGSSGPTARHLPQPLRPRPEAERRVHLSVLPARHRAVFDERRAPARGSRGRDAIPAVDLAVAGGGPPQKIYHDNRGGSACLTDRTRIPWVSSLSLTASGAS